MDNALIRGILGGIQGGAAANLKDLQKQADEKRKRSFAALMQQFGQENIQMGNDLAIKRSDSERVQDRADQDQQNKYLEGKTEEERIWDAAENDRNYNRQRALIESNRKGPEPSEYDKKLAVVNQLYKNKQITDEEYKQFVLGTGGKNKGGLSDAQQISYESKLADVESMGVDDDATANKANVYRKALGMPLLVKKEVEPMKKNLIGTTPAKYEFVEEEPAGEEMVTVEQDGKTYTVPKSSVNSGSKQEPLIENNHPISSNKPAEEATKQDRIQEIQKEIVAFEARGEVVPKELIAELDSLTKKDKPKKEEYKPITPEQREARREKARKESKK